MGIIKKIHIALVAIFFPLLAYTQVVVSFPYFCGFEDAAENAEWIGVGANILGSQNKWQIGQAEKSEDNYGLYISSDGGNTAGCENKANFLSIYRIVTLKSNTTYNISFDWKNPGYGGGKLYVCWIPNNANDVPTLSDLGDNMPAWVKKYGYSFTDRPDTMLTNAPVWQNASFNVKGSGRPYRLLFYWQNTSASQHPSGRIVAAGCIDNVQIAEENICIKPTELKYEQLDASYGLFSWEGDGNAYELKYKGTYDSEWTETILIKEGNKTQRVKRLDKGSYIAAIRSFCEEDPMFCDPPNCRVDTSNWAIFPLLVHYSSKYCIDFIDFKNPNVATTYWGSVNNPFVNKNAIDYGYTSEYSRHTIHYLADEYDAMSGYQLKTIPPDGTPSIRLGNPLVPVDGAGVPDGEASADYVVREGGGEAIVYEYVVDEEAPLLLIKYALVLDDPSHTPKNQPKFEINIYDEDGNESSEFMCGEVEYIADKNAEGWHLGIQTSTGQIIWKDWSTVGLNLQEVAGQNVTIEIVTRDCAQGGHPGYAYFTMDCMGAKVSGIGCGDSMLGKITAPEGFNYKWYPERLKNEMDSLALEAYLNSPEFPTENTERTYAPPADDTGVYICRVISLDQPDCFFELEANLDPRDVYTKFDPIIACGSNNVLTVTMDNISYTETRNGKERGECDYYEWWVNGELKSTEKSPTWNDLAPGEYKIRLYAAISDKSLDEVGEEVESVCFDEKDTTIVIPDYTPDTIYAQTCSKYPDYKFEGAIYNKTGIYTKKYTSIYGCDSIKVLNLTVADETKIILNDTTTTEVTLYGEGYYFEGTQLFETGAYQHLISGIGEDCDTIIELHLVVDTILKVEIDDIQEHDVIEVCSDWNDFSAYYKIVLGAFDSFVLEFGEDALAAGFSDYEIREGENLIVISLPYNVRPDSYEARFIFLSPANENGVLIYDSDTLNIKLNVHYPTSIIKQKWDDMLFVYANGYGGNAGYDFSTYQWYADNIALQGETKSYLFLPEKLRSNVEYRVELTRIDDQVTMRSCVFTAEVTLPDVLIEPTVLSSGEMISVETKVSGKGGLWDVMGNKYTTVDLSNGSGSFRAPEKAGVYLFKVELESSSNQVFRIVVK